MKALCKGYTQWATIIIVRILFQSVCFLLLVYNSKINHRDFLYVWKELFLSFENSTFQALSFRNIHATTYFYFLNTNIYTFAFWSFFAVLITDLYLIVTYIYSSVTQQKYLGQRKAKIQLSMILFGWKSFSQTLRHIRITYDVYEKCSFPKILIQWI